jgi:hypothetical protein
MEERENQLIEKITHFTFQLCRKTSDPPYNLEPLSQLLNTILCSLKEYIFISDYQEEINKYLSLLIYLYKLIPHTRDIYIGKGERDLTYQMIIVWYKVFPKLAIYAMETICSDHMIGSWKDAKYLCHHTKYHTNLLAEDQKQNLIAHIVKYMNQELYKGIHSENPNRPMSLISKWIPREKSKFGWLYESLVKNWIEGYETQNTTQITTHHYKIYRKIISNENRRRLGGDIKDSQKPESPSNLTGNLVEESNGINKKITIQSSENSLVTKSKSYDLGDLCRFVEKERKHQIKTIEKNTEIWNKIQENIYSKMQKSQEPEVCFLPILNINSTNLLDGIAISILLSEISSIPNRIMVHDKIQSHWISLEKQHTLFDKIIEIQKHTFPIPSLLTRNGNLEIQNKNNPILSPMSCILRTIIETKLPPAKIEKMCIIILSDFSPSTHLHLHNTIKNIFHSNKIYKLPCIVYWNISNRIVPNMPCLPDTPNVLFLAGASSSNFDYLLEEMAHPIRITPFDSFQNRINHEKYQNFETYLRKLCSL